MDWHELRNTAIDHLPHELDDSVLMSFLPDADHAAHYGPISGAHNIEWVCIDKLILDEHGTFRAYGTRMLTRFELRLDIDGWVWEQVRDHRRYGRHAASMANADLQNPETWVALAADLPAVLAVDCAYFTCDELAVADINPRDKWRVLVEVA